MISSKFTQEEKKILVEKAQKLRAEGKTIKETTKILQVSDHTLYSYAKELGIPFGRARNTGTSPTTEVRVFRSEVPKTTAAVPQKRARKHNTGKVVVMVCGVADLASVLEGVLQ